MWKRLLALGINWRNKCADVNEVMLTSGRLFPRSLRGAAKSLPCRTEAKTARCGSVQTVSSENSASSSFARDFRHMGREIKELLAFTSNNGGEMDSLES